MREFETELAFGDLRRMVMECHRKVYDSRWTLAKVDEGAKNILDNAAQEIQYWFRQILYSRTEKIAQILLCICCENLRTKLARRNLKKIKKSSINIQH